MRVTKSSVLNDRVWFTVGRNDRAWFYRGEIQIEITMKEAKQLTAKLNKVVGEKE